MSTHKCLNHISIALPRNVSGTLPCTPCTGVDMEMLRRFLDRPAHRPTEGMHAFSEALRLRKWVIAEELYNCWHGCNRRFRFPFLPIEHRPSTHTKERSDGLLRETTAKAHALHVFAKRLGIGINPRWFR